MTNPAPTTPALLVTASLVVLTLALAGCSAPGQAADLDTDTDVNTGMDLPWTWKDPAAMVRAKSYIYAPFEAGSASTMTGTVVVAQGPPLDLLVMTAQDFAAFEGKQTFASVPSCAATQQTQITLGTCTVDAGSYFAVLQNIATYAQDDVGRPDMGPAAVAIDLVLTPNAAV